jgi:hypothetical protein
VTERERESICACIASPSVLLITSLQKVCDSFFSFPFGEFSYPLFTQHLTFPTAGVWLHMTQTCRCNPSLFQTSHSLSLQNVCELYLISFFFFVVVFVAVASFSFVSFSPSLSLSLSRLSLSISLSMLFVSFTSPDSSPLCCEGRKQSVSP